MTIAIVRDPIYRGRRFQSEIIELCVRWYLTYRMSYRDLVEMLAERGVVVSHTTIYRWVQQYVPEFDRRWSRYAKAVHRAIKGRCAPMLSLKSFRTAAITLAGVELAHRIRKGQFSLRPGAAPELSSFKHLWARALKRRVVRTSTRLDEPQPPTQQNSKPIRLLSEQDVRSIEPVRHPRKITVGRCLYLNVT